MMDISLYMENERIPELFCGFERRRAEGPTSYPVACSPQAWAVASVFMMVQACLGIEINASHNCIYFNEPSLPDFLNYLEIDDLKINSGSISFRAEKQNESVAINVLQKTGDIEIIVRL